MRCTETFALPMDDSKLSCQCFRNWQFAFGFISFRFISFASFFSFVFFSLLQFEHTLKNVSCRGLLSYYFRRRRRRWRWVCCNPRRLRFPRSVYRSVYRILHSTPFILLLLLLGLFATFISFCCNIAQLQLGIEIGPINAAFV